MKKILKSAKGDSGPVSAPMAFIIFLIMGVIFMVALIYAAGLQTNFLCAFSGSGCSLFGSGEQAVVASAGLSTISKIHFISGLLTQKPKVSDPYTPEQLVGKQISQIAVGNFRGNGNEVVAATTENEIWEIFPDEFKIASGLGLEGLTCGVANIFPMTLDKSSGKEDLFVFVGCVDNSNKLQLPLYRITKITKYESKATEFDKDFLLHGGYVLNGGYVFASGDFDQDKDGKTDIAVAKKDGTGITVFYNIDPDKKSYDTKDISLTGINLPITAIAAGNFSGKELGMLFITMDNKLYLLKTPLTKPELKEIEFMPGVGISKYYIICGNFDGKGKDEAIIFGKGGGKSVFLYSVTGLNSETPKSEILPISIVSSSIPIDEYTVSIAAGKFI